MPFWGIFAFDFEFNGQNSVDNIHYCNVMMFIANVLSIAAVIKYHRVCITKQVDD